MSSDFNVDWKGTEEATAREVIIHLVVSKLKAGMPVTIIVVGKSSSGKSAFALHLQDIIYESMGIDFASIVDKCVLIKPDDWVDKTEQIFFSKDPEWKQIVSLQMDEAKFLINSDDWQKQKNKAIRGITATSRSIKPVVFIIVAQLLKDVDAKTRETVDIIFEVKRSPKKRPVVIPTTLYERRFDINRIVIKPKRLSGQINLPDGTCQYVSSLELHPPMPRKEVWDKYKSFEVPDKTAQIKALFDSMRDTQDKISGESSKKLIKFAEWLSSNPEELEKYGAWNRKKGVWALNENEAKKFNYSRKEIREIEALVLNKFSSVESDSNGTSE